MAEARGTAAGLALLDTIDRAVPMWLDVTDGKTTVRDLPLRDQIDIPVREQLIVELYSK